MYYCFDCAKLPTITGFYNVTRNTVWQFTEKTHILLYITEGICTISMEGTDYTLQAGDVFFIPANRSYTRRSINGTMCSMTYVHFSVDAPIVEEEAADLARQLSNLRQELENRVLEGEQNPQAPTQVYLQPLTRSDKHAKELKELFEKILHASSNRRLLYNMGLSTDLCRVLILLSRDTIDKLLSNDFIQDAAPVPRNLKRAIEYIIANYSTQITLDDLARQCNVSKQQVIRYFKSSLNTTPIQYINHYRLSRAKELLYRHQHLTIKEIANELGFDNQHYFTRLFTSTYRETPSQYRHRTIHYVENAKKDPLP